MTRLLGILWLALFLISPAKSCLGSVSTLGGAGGINLYRTLGNSPMNLLDPWGLSTGDDWLDRVTGGDTLTPLSPHFPGIDTEALAEALGALGDELLDLDNLQDVLGRAEVCPGVGDAASALNAGIDFFKGDYKAAAVGLGATVSPGVGPHAFKTATRGQTVLGKFPDYLKLADELGAKRFNIPTSVWNKMSKAEQWAANQKFLDRAISRGDDIILSNPVKNINDVTGAFRQELDYLIGNGFRLSGDGSRMTR